MSLNISILFFLTVSGIHAREPFGTKTRWFGDRTRKILNLTDEPGKYHMNSHRPVRRPSGAWIPWLYCSGPLVFPVS